MDQVTPPYYKVMTLLGDWSVGDSSWQKRFAVINCTANLARKVNHLFWHVVDKDVSFLGVTFFAYRVLSL